MMAAAVVKRVSQLRVRPHRAALTLLFRLLASDMAAYFNSL